ncbi:unnamed protein product [Pleuronectes platessa]|uniref:Uncharacterized protein n=1 Tax=Pleuronectes platessa TaxID=8262 RepID=A0A9N7V7V9_PLEPL|nr:unnamed protein product [Pleuronectes platessa]
MHSVLAHEDGWGEDGPVRSANVSTFITTECLPWVIYTRHCLSEEEEHTSNCTIDCSKKVLPLEAEIKKITSRSRIIPVIIIIIVSFVIVLLVGLIYFRSRRTSF